MLHDNLNNIQYRPATRDDIPQMVTLMNSQYKRQKADAYFLWQYFDSFYPAVSMCAFLESKLIGMFGLIKKELTNGLACAQVIDLLIDHNYRGKGIFQELNTRAESYFPDVKAFYVYPNFSGKNACEKNNYRTLAKIDTLLLTSRSAVDTKTIVTTSATNTSLRLASTEKYRQWRYDSNPEYKYTIVRGDNDGYAITKIFVDPVTEERFGDIVDYECKATANLVELFIRAQNYLWDQGVSNVTTWALEHTPLYQIVTILGFVPKEEERYFCIKILDAALDYLYNLKQWELVQADTEVF